MDTKSNKTLIAIVAAVAGVLLVAGIGYAISQSTTSPEPIDSPQDKAVQQRSTTTQPDSSTTTPSSTATTEPAVTIIFTDDGFEPSTYTVKRGSVIKVTNNSAMDLQFSSDDHPAHTDEPELNLGVLKPGESDSFTVTKVGTWKFHDHLNDEFSGSLTVTQ